MKKLFVTFTIMVAATTAHSQSESGVIINGIEWATHNVGKPGEFVANPQDYGDYYKYKEAQTACPSGWRTPTRQEFESLIKSGREWVKMRGVIGCLFGSENNTIFLPLAGCRDYLSGALERQSEYGYYWSATEHNPNSTGNYLYLELGLRITASYVLNFSMGCPVRCVRCTD